MKDAQLRQQIAAVEHEFQSEISRGRPAFDPKGGVERPYDAFLLYSHTRDAHLAAAIQDALQQFAKPWYKLRSLRVFRDATNLAATPDLWRTITIGLERSKYLILLASPEAATSMWVNRELSYWLEHRSFREILIVLAGGDIVWNEGTGDFDWQRTTALPSNLQGVFPSEPLWLDVRSLRSAGAFSPRNPEYQNAIASLAAPILGVPKHELIGADVRENRRRWRLLWWAGAVTALLGVAVTIAALLARG